MPQKNSHGKFILSAGEIGTYAVCPESWRLRRVAKVPVGKSESAERGAELHKEWANRHEEAIFFAKGIKTLLLLIAAALVIGFLVAH